MVCGIRSTFDEERSPRLGVLGSGNQKTCIHASREKSSLLLVEMSSLSTCAASGAAVLRSAARGGALTDSKDSLGA